MLAFIISCYLIKCYSKVQHNVNLYMRPHLKFFPLIFLKVFKSNKIIHYQEMFVAFVINLSLANMLIMSNMKAS